MLCEGGYDLGRPCDEWFQWIGYSRVRVFHRESIGAKFVLIVENLSDQNQLSRIIWTETHAWHSAPPIQSSPGPGGATYNASKLSPRLGLQFQSNQQSNLWFRAQWISEWMLVKPQWLEVYQHTFHTVLVTFLLLKSKTLSMAQCPPEVRKAVKAMRVVLVLYILLIFLDVSSPARLYHENIRNVRSMSMYMWHSGT